MYGSVRMDKMPISIPAAIRTRIVWMMVVMVFAFYCLGLF